MDSLPTTEQANLDNYWEIVRKLEPEFYLIRVALKETGVNPMIIPKVIRALGNLAVGTGYGKIQVFMQRTVVTQIKGEESDELNEPTIIDKV